MPANNPKPPQGYNLVPIDNTVPAFIRSGIDTSKVKQEVQPLNQDNKPYPVIATATAGNIAVYKPELYTAQIRNHEMTHEFQQSRSNGTIPLPDHYEIRPFGYYSSAAPKQYVGDDPRNYNYGYEDGLVALRNQHKTAADLNVEQQATLVEDYKAKQDAYLARVKEGVATPDDLRQMYATFQAYHPFVQQMANVPSKLRDTLPTLHSLLGIGKPAPLAPAPPAPGLPSYDTPGLGVAPADPLLGGQSQPIDSTVGRKVGTIKRFENGKIGKWDGYGWLQVTQ